MRASVSRRACVNTLKTLTVRAPKDSVRTRMTPWLRARSRCCTRACHKRGWRDCSWTSRWHRDGCARGLAPTEGVVRATRCVRVRVGEGKTEATIRDDRMKLDHDKGGTRGEVAGIAKGTEGRRERSGDDELNEQPIIPSSPPVQLVERVAAGAFGLLPPPESPAGRLLCLLLWCGG
eukprot:6200213-Pleurochrysis_carterae.AAC.6